MHNIPLEYLDYFLAVAKYGNESMAAQHLLVDQSRINRSIKYLKEVLGHPLYERKQGRMQLVALTPYGERLLRYAESRLATKAQLEADLARIAQGYTSVLRLAMVPGVSHALHTHYLLPLLKQHEDWQVETRECGVAELERALLQHEVELGLTNCQIPHLQAFKVLQQRTTPYQIICRQDNPWLDTTKTHCIRDLKGVPLCLTAGSAPPVCEAFAKYGLQPLIRTRNTMRQTSICDVKLGLGVALYPTLLPPDDKELTSMELKEPGLFGKDLLLQNPAHSLSPIAKEFAAFYLSGAK